MRFLGALAIDSDSSKAKAILDINDPGSEVLYSKQ